MAQLIFNDGVTRSVSYNKAARIYQILLGKVQPENKPQANYVSRVKEVVFDRSPKAAAPVGDPDARKKAIRHFTHSREIYGIDRARAVAAAIRGERYA